jgi:hypothetical protein
MFGVIHLYKWYTRPTPIESPLSTKVKAPSVSFRDEGFDVTVRVANWAEYPAEGVTVAIKGRTMPRLVCTSVDPPDCYLERSPRVLTAFIGDLAPGEIRVVSVHFMAERAGELHLMAQVTADNMQGGGRTFITGEVVP